MLLPRNTQLPLSAWIPMSLEEASKRGWDSFDVILVTGDAYVDHPSFGAAVIARILESEGYRVGIISQPNWRDDLRDFRKLGAPRLFFGVTAGNMDSMVNHYTGFRRLRSDDAYTAGGKSGFRPDYATTVYSTILRNLFPETPVVIGGVEASMRRAAHYDFWSDTVMPTILTSSGADLLVYGMGERAISEVAAYYQNGASEENRVQIRQIAFLSSSASGEISASHKVIELPSFEECQKDKLRFAEAFKVIETESNRMEPAILVQKTGDRYLVITPPEPLTTTAELDHIFALPYTRLPHPRYKKRGDVPAWTMIKDSITLHRGCFGGCSFCTISMHQGKFIASRSEQSILQEVSLLTQSEGFNGVISDLGGPSANMYKMKGIDSAQCRRCSRPSCLWPSICRNLNFDHSPLLSLYQKARKADGVKHVFIGSGIRYDMLTGQKADVAEKYKLNEYMQVLLRHHVSGRLKVAPEHSSDRVLSLIRKPGYNVYRQFREEFYKTGKKLGLKQQLIPYLISSLPGCETRDMAELAAELAASGYRPEQVQDFTPTPMTLSSTLFHTGFNPYTGEKVFVPTDDQQRRDQRKFLFYYKEENAAWIIQKLKQTGQTELARTLFVKEIYRGAQSQKSESRVQKRAKR